MAALCLYRTVFVVGAVLTRLEQFLLGWCTSCSVGALETSAPPERSSSCLIGVTSCSVGALETSAPP